MDAFMMPPQGGMVGELPPGMIPPEAVAQPVPMMPPPQGVPLPPPQTAPAPAPAPAVPAPVMAAATAPAAEYSRILQEEGGHGDTPTGEGFFDKLRMDPKMSQAMLMMGARMMQGNKHNQDDMGMLGDAMMAAATAHNMLSYNEKHDAQKDAEFALKTKGENARIAGMEQEQSQKAELFPNTKKKLEQDLANAQTDAERKRAEVRIKQFESDPERMAKREGLENQRIADQSTASRAAAGASSAAAGNSRSVAEERKQELDWKKTIADPKASEADKKLARDGLQAGQVGRGAGAASAGVQNRQDLYKFYEGITPNATVAELNQKVLDHETTAKKKEVGAELSEFAYKHGFDITKEEGLAEARKRFDQVYGVKAAAPAGKPAAASAGMPPVESRVAGKTTFVNPQGVTLVWDGSKWGTK